MVSGKASPSTVLASIDAAILFYLHRGQTVVFDVAKN